MKVGLQTGVDMINRMELTSRFKEQHSTILSQIQGRRRPWRDMMKKFRTFPPYFATMLRLTKGMDGMFATRHAGDGLEWCGGDRIPNACSVQIRKVATTVCGVGY